MQAFEVRRVPVSSDLSRPGDYAFVAKREPRIHFESEPLPAPKGFFRSMLWSIFGKKYEMKRIVEVLWPEIDTVIINCPSCNSPCATTKGHTIVSVEPLTIETPITCPYCRTKTFEIKEGKVLPIVYHAT